MADLIERKAALDALWRLQRALKIIDKSSGADIMIQGIQLALRKIERLPSAQPEQKVGKWIRHENEDGEPYGHNCSVCGEWYVMPYGKTKFCPNCGAKMEEKDDR